MYKGIEVFHIRGFLTENNDGVIGTGWSGNY